MSKILFIGEYFPKFSQLSVRNHVLASHLTSYGHKVTLLSDSWCRVKEADFLDDNDFDQKPFAQIYFLDPLQVRYIGERKDDLVRHMVGLAFQIIETEPFDYIYVSSIEYITVGQLIKSCFKIPMILGIYNDNIVILLNETYTKSLLSVTLNQFDLILSNKFTKDILLNLNKKLPCEEGLPFSSVNPQEEVFDAKNMSELYLIGKLRFNNKYFYNLPDSLRNYKINAILYGEGKERLLSLLNSNFNVHSINITNLSDLKTFIPKGAAVINTYDFEIEPLPDLNRLMILLKCGFKPFVNEKAKQYLSFYYDVKISNHADFSMLESMDFTNIKEVSSFFD
ncbi:MAG: hypothetical protein K0S30_742 [Clostridia bacterium]|jgi:hypothetical protein|nr:hypothetical protein [Clostridia bacterium]